MLRCMVISGSPLARLLPPSRHVFHSTVPVQRMLRIDITPTVRPALPAPLSGRPAICRVGAAGAAGGAGSRLCGAAVCAGAALCALLLPADAPARVGCRLRGSPPGGHCGPGAALPAARADGAAVGERGAVVQSGLCSSSRFGRMWGSYHWAQQVQRRRLMCGSQLRSVSGLVVSAVPGACHAGVPARL